MFGVGNACGKRSFHGSSQTAGRGTTPRPPRRNYLDGASSLRGRLHSRPSGAAASAAAASACVSDAWICEGRRTGRYGLEVVDVCQRPGLAEGEQIIAARTISARLPLRGLIGDISPTSASSSASNPRKANGGVLTAGGAADGARRDRAVGDRRGRAARERRTAHAPRGRRGDGAGANVPAVSERSGKTPTPAARKCSSRRSSRQCRTMASGADGADPSDDLVRPEVPSGPQRRSPGRDRDDYCPNRKGGARVPRAKCRSPADGCPFQVTMRHEISPSPPACREWPPFRAAFSREREHAGARRRVAARGPRTRASRWRSPGDGPRAEFSARMCAGVRRT